MNFWSKAVCLLSLTLSLSCLIGESGENADVWRSAVPRLPHSVSFQGGLGDKQQSELRELTAAVLPTVKAMAAHDYSIFTQSVPMGTLYSDGRQIKLLFTDQDTVYHPKIGAIPLEFDSLTLAPIIDDQQDFWVVVRADRLLFGPTRELRESAFGVLAVELARHLYGTVQWYMGRPIEDLLERALESSGIEKIQADVSRFNSIALMKLCMQSGNKWVSSAKDLDIAASLFEIWLMSTQGALEGPFRARTLLDFPESTLRIYGPEKSEKILEIMTKVQYLSFAVPPSTGEGTSPYRTDYSAHETQNTFLLVLSDTSQRNDLFFKFGILSNGAIWIPSDTVVGRLDQPISTGPMRGIDKLIQTVLWTDEIFSPKKEWNPDAFGTALLSIASEIWAGFGTAVSYPSSIDGSLRGMSEWRYRVLFEALDFAIRLRSSKLWRLLTDEDRVSVENAYKRFRSQFVTQNCANSLFFSSKSKVVPAENLMPKPDLN